MHLSHDLPTQNLEAERGVIASIALDYRFVADVEATGLARGHFYNPGYGRIYAEVLTMFRERISFDIVLLTSRLRAAGELESIGESNLCGIFGTLPIGHNAGHFARQIIEAARRRNFVIELEGLTERARSGENLAAVTAEVHNAVEECLTHSAAGSKLESVSLADFDAGDYRLDYLIRNVVPVGECGIIAAPFKGCKTHLAGDMAVSVATGTDFLGCDRFGIECAIRAGFISVESGKPAMKEMFRRICRARGIAPADVGNLFISTDCPQLPGEVHLVERFIRSNALRFVVLDPAYLMLSGMAGESASDMAMGNALRTLTELGKNTNCTIALVAHNRKGRLQHQKKFDPPELAEIAHAGFAAWARWFVMLSTRKDFDAEVGQHWLHMRTLGSAGHGGLWAVDIFEGRQSDAGGRVWQVEVRTAGDERRQRESEQSKAEQDRRQRKIDGDVLKLRRALKKHPHGETDRQVRLDAGLNPDAMAEALDVLQGRGEVEPCQVVKSKRTYDGIRWRDPWGLTGTPELSGTDSGTNSACSTRSAS